MTWWSEHSAAPRFVLAKLAIRCRFVDRFVGFRAPSHVSDQRFSTRGALLPSAGSRQARFPVFLGTMKAPRTCSLMISVTGSTRPSCVRVRLSAPDEPGGKLIRPGPLVQPVFPARHAAPVGARGISQVPWRPVPSLCPAPRPRPSRRDLAASGRADTAPGLTKPKASAST